ncbi:hypothetical protein OB13_19185, partial [Pontibacter sp. HJ8]
EYLKKLLPKAGIQQSTIRRLKFKTSLLKEKAKLVKAQGYQPILHAVPLKAVSSGTHTSYRLSSSRIVLPDTSPFINKNSLRDLLCYQPKGTLTTRWEFLIDAMKRFESGQQPYTWVENGKLLGCVWLQSPGLKAKEIPAEAAVLQGFYFYPVPLKQLQEFVEAVIAKVTGERDSAFVYAIPDAQNKALCKVLHNLSSNTS